MSLPAPAQRTHAGTVYVSGYAAGDLVPGDLLIADEGDHWARARASAPAWSQEIVAVISAISEFAPRLMTA